MNKKRTLLCYLIIAVFRNVVCAMNNTTEVRIKELQTLVVKSNSTLEFTYKLKYHTIKACSIETPYNKVYPLYYEDFNFSYENRRINMTVVNSGDCKVQIQKIDSNDNGIWKCTLSWQDTTSGLAYVSSQLFDILVYETYDIPIAYKVIAIILILLICAIIPLLRKC